MVIYDFKGGKYSLTMYQKDVFPFSIYDFPNIQVETSVYYNAEVNVMMTIYAANNFAKFDDCYILSGKNKSLFKLTDANGFVKMKYTSPYWSNETGEALTTKSHGDENNQSTVITFNGGGRIDSIKVNAAKLFGVDLGSIGTVDSKDYFLPISYRYKIIIGAGMFEISNKVRFITGSAMIINQGAQVNFSTAAMFYQSFTDKAGVYPYPSKPAAKLICNGKAVFSTWFGGEILTENDMASVSFLNGFVDNCDNTEMDGDGKATHSEKAMGRINDGTSIKSNVIFKKNSYYLSGLNSESGYWNYNDHNLVSVSVSSTNGLETAKATAKNFNLKAVISGLNENEISGYSWNWSVSGDSLVCSKPGDAIISGDFKEANVYVPANKDKQSVSHWAGAHTYTYTISLEITDVYGFVFSSEIKLKALPK